MEPPPPPPHLKLVMLQGPREGESFEFPPGTAVRIGRVARGNNLPIKDPGISSKHLSILTHSNQWVLRDLNSSNGTVFDGSKIPPNTPFFLHDAASIKIGELTSIHVTLINHHHNAATAAANPRRNPTRRGRTEPVEPDPDYSLSVQPAAKEGGGRRKGLKEKVQIQSVEEDAVEGSGFVDRPESKRVIRNTKNKRVAVAFSETNFVDLGVPIEEEPKKTRVTRNSKKKESVIEVSDSSALEKKVVVEEPKNTRVTRNLKKKESVIEVSDSGAREEEKVLEQPKNTRVARNLKKKESVIEVSDSSALEEKVLDEPKNTRVTRSSKKGQSVVGNSPHEDSVLDVRVEDVEGKRTRGGDRRRKLKGECSQAAELEEDDKVGEVEPNRDGNEDGGVRDGDGDGDLCGVKEGGDDGREGQDCSVQKEDLNGDGNWPDLEKLSLGQWFDFLEVHLPKQIVDATEEMIESMRQKAERLRDYITQQKMDDMGKLPLL